MYFPGKNQNEKDIKPRPNFNRNSNSTINLQAKWASNRKHIDSLQQSIILIHSKWNKCKKFYLNLGNAIRIKEFLIINIKECKLCKLEPYIIEKFLSRPQKLHVRRKLRFRWVKGKRRNVWLNFHWRHRWKTCLNSKKAAR